MSIENLKEFGIKIAQDEQVRDRAKAIGLNPEGIIAYGKELGLDFNESDLKALADEAGNIEDELSEEQLEMIAGGVATTTIAGVAVCLTIILGLGLAAGGVGGAVAGAIKAARW